MKELFKLFFIFAKIGAITFGGGYSMLPMFERELVEKRGYATMEEIMNYFAVGQCTPGVIAVNTATFIGHKIKGVWGGVFATLGIVFPSLVIISIIAMFLQNFADYAVVQHAFSGIRACVVGLIINALIKLSKQGIKDYIGVILAIVSFGLISFLSVSPIFVTVGAGICGVIVCSLRGELK